MVLVVPTPSLAIHPLHLINNKSPIHILLNATPLSKLSSLPILKRASVASRSEVKTILKKAAHPVLPKDGSAGRMLPSLRKSRPTTMLPGLSIRRMAMMVVIMVTSPTSVVAVETKTIMLTGFRRMFRSIVLRRKRMLTLLTRPTECQSQLVRLSQTTSIC
jgi:hypothetical protein